MQVTEESCHCVRLSLPERKSKECWKTLKAQSASKTGVRPKPQLLTQGRGWKKKTMASSMTLNTSISTCKETPHHHMITSFTETYKHTVKHRQTHRANQQASCESTHRQNADIGHGPILLHNSLSISPAPLGAALIGNRKEVMRAKLSTTAYITSLPATSLSGTPGYLAQVTSIPFPQLVCPPLPIPQNPQQPTPKLPHNWAGHDRKASIKERPWDFGQGRAGLCTDI